jgi:hypothetical protein
MDPLRCSRCGHEVADEDDGLIIEWGVMVDGEFETEDGVWMRSAICNGCLTPMDLHALGLEAE